MALGYLAWALCIALQHLSEARVRRTRAGARHLMADEKIAALAHDLRLLNLVRDSLGSDAIPLRATLFDKSSDANWLVVWHQDTALPLTQRGEIAGLPRRSFMRRLLPGQRYRAQRARTTP